MLGFIINFYRNIKHYFKNISIHGLSSIFHSNYLIEMVFWIIIFIIAVQYFYGLIYVNLLQFYNQPTTKSIDTASYPVNMIPFPAITVCNFNIVYKSRSISLVKLLVENGIEEIVVLSFLKSLALLRSPFSIDVEPYRQIYKILAQNGHNNHSILMETLAQPCSALFKSCSWKGEKINCNELFFRSKGDLGFCCSFNSYLNSANHTDYYTTAGPLRGMYLKFNIDPHEYVSALYNVTGVMVLVHNKQIYPFGAAVFSSVVETGKQVAMKIIPDVFQAEPNVQDLPINARNCWFPNEGLKFSYLNYSFENCMHLCQADTVARFCGCVPYYYAELGQWRDCTLLDMPCLSKYYKNYTALEINLNQDARNKYAETCDCLPACSGFYYRGDIESFYYIDKPGKVDTNSSGVWIYFRNHWCKKYRVARSLTTDSFIALVGGFFSLCVGGSIISACELIYYFFKSLLVKAPDVTEGDKDPPLYWSELKPYSRNLNRNKRNVVIFNPYFQKNYIE